MNNEVTSLPELPKGWIWTRLGDVLGFVKGKKPKNLGSRNNLLTIPYIDINAFENEIFDEFTDGDNCPLCQTDDTLIVWDGARCGLVGRGVAGAIGSTLAKLPCFEVNSTYIFYFLQSMYELINKRPRGVGIPHVEPSLFWNIPLPLAPLPEQHRIVAKIEELFTRLDAGVEALKKIKAQLKRYRQAILKHAFEGKLTEEWRQAHKHELEPASVLLERIKQERPKTAKVKCKELPPLDTSTSTELPEGWVWTRLNNCSSSITKGESPNWQGYEYVDDGIIFIRSENVLWGKVNIAGVAQIPEEFHNKLKRSQIKPNDVLINLVGASIGRCGLVPETIQSANINQAVALVRCNESLLPLYFMNLFLSPQIQKTIHASKVETARPNISLENLRDLVVPLASAAEQHKIVEEIERRFSVADQIEKTVEQGMKQAERLRQSILKRAFEGKLVPQDPNDEPAEKLLERMKEERAKQQAAIKSAKGVKKKANTEQMRLV